MNQDEEMPDWLLGKTYSLTDWLEDFAAMAALGVELAQHKIDPAQHRERVNHYFDCQYRRWADHKRDRLLAAGYYLQQNMPSIDGGGFSKPSVHGWQASMPIVEALHAFFSRLSDDQLGFQPDIAEVVKAAKEIQRQKGGGAS